MKAFILNELEALTQFCLDSGQPGSYLRARISNSMGFSQYSTMIALYGVRLCKHLEKGGSLEDRTAELIYENIVQLISQNLEMRSVCVKSGIDPSIIRSYLIRATSDLRPNIVMTGYGPRNLLCVWMLIDPLLPVTLATLRVRNAESEDERQDLVIQHLIQSAELFRANNKEFQYSDFVISGRRGISRSEAVGCAIFPYLVWSFLIFVALGLFKACSS